MLGLQPMFTGSEMAAVLSCKNCTVAFGEAVPTLFLYLLCLDLSSTALLGIYVLAVYMTNYLTKNKESN